MTPVTVGRYNAGDFATATDGSVGWTGWICTDDWVVFEHDDGRLFVSKGRDPKTGAVLGEPTIV